MNGICKVWPILPISEQMILLTSLFFIFCYSFVTKLWLWLWYFLFLIIFLTYSPFLKDYILTIISTLSHCFCYHLAGFFSQLLSKILLSSCDQYYLPNYVLNTTKSDDIHSYSLICFFYYIVIFSDGFFSATYSQDGAFITN